MKLNSSTSIADQIKRESQLRGARLEEMPSSAKRTQVVYNEDALMVHPDQVFSNPNNSRKTFDEDEIDGLAASYKVKGVGLLEPIIARARKVQQGNLRQYEVIAGDRRLLAARRAGLTSIPIIVRRADDRVARRINLIENIHDKALIDSEMGAALVELKDDMQEELNEFLLKAHFIVSEEHDALPLEAATWTNAQTQFPDLPTWMHGVIERAVAQRERGVIRAPKVTWEDVAPEVGFSQVRSVHYYVSISKLVEDEDDETEDGKESAEDQETKKVVSAAISSGELSQQQSRALTALAPAQQKRLLDEIRSGKLSGPAAQQRAKELQGRKSASPRLPVAKDALSQLSALSLPSEQIRAAREVAEVVAKLRVAVEGRFTQYSPFDSQSKMEMRRQLTKMRAELEAIEALVAPSNAKERAEETAKNQEMEATDEPPLRLVG